MSSNHCEKSGPSAKKTRWQAVAKLKPAEQGQISILQTSNPFLLQGNPTPFTKLEWWKIENSLGYKIETGWKSTGSVPTKLDIGYDFLLFLHKSKKNAPTKLGFIYVE